MVFAGTSVLIDNATRFFRKKECSKAAYGFAMALTTYWSFALGQPFLLTLAEPV